MKQPSGHVAARARPLQRRAEPPGGFAAITAITKLTGTFGLRRRALKGVVARLGVTR